MAKRLQVILKDPEYREIAKQLGVPVGSIGPMRARAFKKLETILLSMGFDGKG